MADQNNKPLNTKSVDLREKFKKIGKQIGAVVVDFTSLNVTTLSGKINHVIQTEEGKKSRFDFNKVIKEIGEAGTTKTDVYVVAHTHIAFDHDTVNFIKEDLKKQDVHLVQFHLQSCEAAQVARKSFLNFIKEFK